MSWSDNDTPSDLSALVGARICHDLVNPLGAIGNGVELLHMTGRGDSPELTLIGDAVRRAQGRLDLFRLAFGAASPGEPLPPDRLHRVIDAAFADGPVLVTLDECSLSRRAGKALSLALLCLETALPRGGQVTITPGAQGMHLWARGQIRPLPDLWEHLQHPPGDMPPPGMVQFALLGQMMQGTAVRRSETPQDLHLTLPLLD